METAHAMMEATFTKTTHLVKVTAVPMYLVEQSEPEEDHFVWAYTIHIENHGECTVQLISRYWHITDALGQVQEVNGAGVVGEQPVLEPGEVYQYTSGVVLPTSSGIMDGYYEMENLSSGERFHVVIPAFSLDSPGQILRAN
jgi:ApaG protein